MLAPGKKANMGIGDPPSFLLHVIRNLLIVIPSQFKVLLKHIESSTPIVLMAGVTGRMVSVQPMECSEYIQAMYDIPTHIASVKSCKI